MTEHPGDDTGTPDGAAPEDPRTDEPEHGQPKAPHPEPGPEDSSGAGQGRRRRRRPRRAVRGGTNPSARDGIDVAPPRDAPVPGETEHDRWLREQRPPHWE